LNLNAQQCHAGQSWRQFVIDYTKDSKAPGSKAAIDQQKAYSNVDHKFIYNTYIAYIVTQVTCAGK